MALFGFVYAWYLMAVLLPFAIVSTMIWLFLPRTEMAGGTRTIND